MQDEGDPVQTVSYKYGCQTIPAPSVKMNTKWSTIHRVSYTKDAINYN